MVIRGTIGYFLVDNGAAVTCVGRNFVDSLLFFDNSEKPITITVTPLRKYGQVIMSLEIGVKIFRYAPTFSDISEDDIFGAECLEYYGCELHKAGVLYIHNHTACWCSVNCVVIVRQCLLSPKTFVLW